MDDGSSWATLARFFEIKRRAARAALTYLEWSHFSERDDLNRHYLAAKLALELGDMTTARLHLEPCVMAKARARHPEKLDALVRQLKSLTET
jgi:DNA-binding GntR family transcriptional regulator